MLHIKGALAAVHLKAFHAVEHTVIDCKSYSWHRMRCLLAMAAWHQAGTGCGARWQWLRSTTGALLK